MADFQKLIPFIEEILARHEERANTLVDERTVQFLRNLLSDLQASADEDFEA